MIFFNLEFGVSFMHVFCPECGAELILKEDGSVKCSECTFERTNTLRTNQIKE